jgi:hypothetical protein
MTLTVKATIALAWYSQAIYKRADRGNGLG